VWGEIKNLTATPAARPSHKGASREHEGQGRSGKRCEDKRTRSTKFWDQRGDSPTGEGKDGEHAKWQQRCHGKVIGRGKRMDGSSTTSIHNTQKDEGSEWNPVDETSNGGGGS